MNLYLNNLFADSSESPITIKNRIGFLQSIADKVPDAKDLSFLRKEKIVLDRVNDSTNPGTRYTRLVHIMKALDMVDKAVSKKTYDRYNTLTNQVKPLKVAKVNDNILSEKQKDNLMSISHLDKLLELKLTKLYETYGLHRSLSKADLNKITRDGNLFKFGQEFQKIVSMAVYVWQPALRNNWAGMEWATTKRQASDDKTNYYLKKATTSQLIMRRYKNDYSMGEQIIDVRSKLDTLMKHWYLLLSAMLGEKPKYVLLYKINSKSISYNENTETFKKLLPRLFKDLCGKEQTINSLRHAWEKQIQTDIDYKNLSVNEKEQLHRELLHNFNTAQRYHLLYRESE